MQLSDLEFNIANSDVVDIIRSCVAQSVVLLDMDWNKFKNIC